MTMVGKERLREGGYSANGRMSGMRIRVCNQLPINSQVSQGANKFQQDSRTTVIMQLLITGVS